MKAIRQRVAVRDGRLELSDPALRDVTEAEVVVLLPDAHGDGAPPGPPPTAEPGGGLPLVDAEGRPVFLPERPDRTGYTLTDMIGAAPSGRAAEEVDRELRELRDEWDERFP